MSSRRERDSNLIFRRATAADADAVRSILVSAFSPLEHLYTPEAYVATVVPASGVLARLREGPIWVACRAATIVGTLSAVSNADAVLVRGMAVRPEARGQGLGQILLEHAEHFAREEGRARMVLYTTAFLDNAIRLYRAYGFEFTGEVVIPHGTELLQMSKDLGGDMPGCIANLSG